MKEQYKLLLPSLTITAGIVAVPTIFLFYMSLQQWVLFIQEITFIGLGNYSSILTSSEFLGSIVVTVILVTSSTLLTLLFGLLLALILNEDLSGKGVFRALFTLPAIIPPVVAGFVWKFLLNREVGVLGGYIFPSLGLQKSILGDPVLALIAVLIFSSSPRDFGSIAKLMAGSGNSTFLIVKP